MYVIAPSDFNLFGYDFQDVMHNDESSSERQKIRGLFAEIKTGLFLNFGNSGKSQGKTSTRNSGGGRSGHTNYLPFAR